MSRETKVTVKARDIREGMTLHDLIRFIDEARAAEISLDEQVFCSAGMRSQIKLLRVPR